MSIQLFQQNGATISSLEIAQITGKNHAHVLRDLEKTLADAEIDASKFGGIYLDAYKREKPCYNLPRFECDLVVSGYSVKYRAAIIKRWHELEAAQVAPQFQLPTNMAEALRLAADSIERAEVAETKLLEAAPKVEFFDTVTKSNTVVTMAVAAQTAKLPFGQNILYRKLREMGVLISTGSRYNLPKQQYIEQGLFTVNEHKFERTNGEVDVNFTTHVTQKGIAWISGKMKEAQP